MSKKITKDLNRVPWQNKTNENTYHRKTKFSLADQEFQPNSLMCTSVSVSSSRKGGN